MLISKKRIEETYNLQAENYKGSRQVAKLLLRDMQIPPNPTGLGIGCGDGVTTFELYDQCGKQGKVIGVDISQKMVEKAFENGRRLGYEDVRFMKMDAESLDFPDNMFDIVMSLFTFQFLPDKLKGFKGNVQSLEARRPSGPLLPNRERVSV